MKTTFIIICFITIFIFINNLNANFYKYTDRNGNIRYTDNLGDVPENQRNKTQQYHEIEFKEVKNKSVDNITKDYDSENVIRELGDFQSRNQYYEKLKKEENELNEEYLKLIDEKKQFQKEKEKSKNKVFLEQKADQLNNKISAYDKKRKMLEKKIKDFHDIVNDINKQSNK